MYDSHPVPSFLAKDLIGFEGIAFEDTKRDLIERQERGDISEHKKNSKSKCSLDRRKEHYTPEAITTSENRPSQKTKNILQLTTVESKNKHDWNLTWIRTLKCICSLGPAKTH